MRHFRYHGRLILLAAAFACGCQPFRMWQTPANFSGPNANVIENPLFVPPIDPEFLWNQCVDVVDDYFPIEREDRMRVINGVLTEGRLDSRPMLGSTVLEPWRKDSTPGYEKVHATLQTIRRKAVVRVIPSAGGYLLDVTVFKELEDLSKPVEATAGSAALRHDGTYTRVEGPAARAPAMLGWIPLGRDFTLEQRMLADLRARISTVVPMESSPATVVNSAPEWNGSEQLEEIPVPLEELSPTQPQP